MPQITEKPEIILLYNDLGNYFDEESDTVVVNSETIKKATNIDGFLDLFGHKNTSDFDISIYYVNIINPFVWEEDLLKTEINTKQHNIKEDRLEGSIFQIKFNYINNPSVGSNISIKMKNSEHFREKISKIMVSIKLIPSNLKQLKSKFIETAGSLSSKESLPKIQEINFLKERIGQLSNEQKLLVSSSDKTKYLISNIPNNISTSDLTLTLLDFQDEQNIKSGTIVSKFDSITNTLPITPDCGIKSGKIVYNNTNDTYTLNLELDKKCNGLVESRIIGHNFIVEFVPNKGKKNYHLEFESENASLIFDLKHDLDIDFLNSDYKFKCEGIYNISRKLTKKITQQVCVFNVKDENFKQSNDIEIETEKGLSLGLINLNITDSHTKSIGLNISNIENSFVKFIKLTMSISAKIVTFNFVMYDSDSYINYLLDNPKGKD